MTDPAQRRIAYIDWLRGFACVLMFQTHGYDAWLSPEARRTGLFAWSQLGGTLPAPLFLFLAGLSIALVTDRTVQKGVSPGQAARFTMRRGLEIFGLSLLFRLQEFLLGQPWAPWTDLLRVDVLNVIGLSIVLVGAACWLAGAALSAGVVGGAVRLRTRQLIAALLGAALIAMATPPLWTTYRPRWLPWYLESYVNGVHTFDRPQSWLFPLFPWSAFAFAGLALGFLLLSPWARRKELVTVACTTAGGILLIAAARWLDALPRQLYTVYDFWHTSPNFFLIRVGVVMSLFLPAYAWCRWGPGRWRFGPLIELGKSSLVVYWVHIEFVYGRFSILQKGTQNIPAATFGIFVILAAMAALAAMKNRWKGKGLGSLAFWRHPANSVALPPQERR